MGKSRTWPYVIYFDRVVSTDGTAWREVHWTPSEWRTRTMGKPTEANLAKEIAGLESSTAPGGVNAHVGISQVLAARVVSQRTGKTLATWNPRPFGVVGTAPRKINPSDPRDDAQLSYFRSLADAMHGGEPQDWEWIGKHLSQRMFGISERRAKEYAKLYGGTARSMQEGDAERSGLLAQRYSEALAKGATGQQASEHARQSVRRKKNPKVTVFHENPRRGARAILQSERVFEIAYKHVQDGDDYIHKFGRGVCLQLLPDGSLRIYSATGKRLWKSFNMKD